MQCQLDSGRDRPVPVSTGPESEEEELDLIRVIHGTGMSSTQEEMGFTFGI